MTQWPLPSPNQNASYYPADYYKAGATKFPKPLEGLRRRDAGMQARFVQRHARVETGSVLDVGYGSGSFLREMERVGWSLAGTEISDAASARSAGLGDIRLFRGDLGDDVFGQETFDAITLWHVIEHMADPIATLTWCRSRLREGGVLVVEVPNMGSMQAALFGFSWLHLDPPRHVYGFSPCGLQLLLQRCGFVVVNQETTSLQMGVFGVL